MVKHTSIREWRRLHKNTTINPEQLSNAAKEICYVPQWAERVTVQPRDIQLARRICGDKDWDKVSYTE